MKTAKIGLFLLLSTAATTSLPSFFSSTSEISFNDDIRIKDEIKLNESAPVHVGDVITIPVGPIKYTFGYVNRVNCAYKVANPRKVYFAADPEGETNILGLVENPWVYTSSPQGDITAVFQAVALKPGTVTIKFDRVPNLGACSCSHGEEVGRKEDKNSGFFSGDKPKQACENACATLIEKETHKDYKAVTITILPAE